jgi:hypothetical protein
MARATKTAGKTATKKAAAKKTKKATKKTSAPKARAAKTVTMPMANAGMMA